MRYLGMSIALMSSLYLSSFAAEPSAGTAFSSIGAVEFRNSLQRGGGVLLDIRTPEEFQQGHITGAVNIDYYEPDFRSKLSALPKARTYYIYCRSGNRTAHTLEIMRELGFKKVTALHGGLLDWAKNGFPLEK